jgi:hypothetical protein
VLRAFTLVAAALAVATVAGLILLWPGEVESQVAQGVAVESEKATVQKVEEGLCVGFSGHQCQLATATIESGPEKGKNIELQLDAGGFDPDVDPGDKIRVAKAPEPPPGSEAVAGTGYTLQDFERRQPMLILFGLFVLVVLAFARWRGALSLVGLAISLVIVLLFVVPAILDGKSALLVAVVGAMAVALTTIPLAHGLGAKSLAALLGSAASLILTALLAVLFTNLTHLTGLSSEEAIFLQIGNADVSLQGLLLAGMVIGALGVLDDVTISQASTVLALRHANPALAFRGLFGLALEVPRPRERHREHAGAGLRRRGTADPVDFQRCGPRLGRRDQPGGCRQGDRGDAGGLHRFDLCSAGYDRSVVTPGRAGGPGYARGPWPRPRS